MTGDVNIVKLHPKSLVKKDQELTLLIPNYLDSRRQNLGGKIGVPQKINPANPGK